MRREVRIADATKTMDRSCCLSPVRAAGLIADKMKDLLATERAPPARRVSDASAAQRAGLFQASSVAASDVYAARSHVASVAFTAAANSSTLPAG